MKRSPFVLLVAVALIVGNPAGAQAETVWSLPVSLASGQGTITGTSLSIADDGSAIAVWTGSSGLGWSRWNDLDWAPAAQIAPAGAASPSVALSDDGSTAIVAYEVGRQVFAARWDAQGWSAPATLAPPSGYFTGPTALIDADGSEAMVVWQQKTGDDYAVMTSRYVSGSWSGPEQVLATGMQMPWPAAAMSDDGQVVMGLSGPGSAGPNVMASWWNGTGWSSPEQLIPVPTAGVTPAHSVAISDDGSIAAAIWSVTLADGSRVQAARHSAAGWGAPENLSIPGTQYGWPRVALSADGDRAVAIWGPSNLAITTDAQAATWSFGAWSSPTPIATGSGLFPQIGVTGDGSAALAVWNATGGTVQSRGWGQGSWQEATTLSDPAVSSAASRVALGSVADQAVILWRTTTGTVQAVSPAGPPDPPTDINAVPGDASITLTWSAPRRDGGRPITGYTATALPGGATCTATELTCTIGGLTNGEGYQVSVRATNLVGTSLASAASHQVVPAPPPTPAQSPAAVEPTAVPGATATPVTTTVISGWVRRMRTKAGKARVRFTVTPAQGRIVQLQRRYRRWRTIRTFNLAVAPSARVSVRLRPGKYRVVVPESPGASSAATPVLRVTDRRR